MQPHKPVTGEMAFSRSEEEKHIQELIDSTAAGVLKDFFPYMPGFVGNQPRVVMGQKVTRLAVEFNIGELGLEATDIQIDAIYSRIRNLAKDERRVVTLDELSAIATEVL